ncbi:hypothetical protein LF1_45310 [Rubripirellula obstinata]|uniref:Uncharacterized protein n=1 Tax=Rubripirellula obstinata TaxID=406547 RepID=A0A5B1CQQ1_9BACT|nr:hypothetical protein [Rubripirellula obstinata]KAA1261970.1 hypothetical protein LF1_45310 [Rubripirellula obstinata]
MTTTTILEQVSSAEEALTQAAKPVPSESSEWPTSPMLEDVVTAIRLDSRRDSLRYALRSNVGHDGE